MRAAGIGEWGCKRGVAEALIKWYLWLYWLAQPFLSPWASSPWALLTCFSHIANLPGVLYSPACASQSIQYSCTKLNLRANTLLCIPKSSSGVRNRVCLDSRVFYNLIFQHTWVLDLTQLRSHCKVKQKWISKLFLVATFDNGHYRAIHWCVFREVSVGQVHSRFAFLKIDPSSDFW